MNIKDIKLLPVTGLILVGIIIGIIFSSNFEWTPKSEAASTPLLNEPVSEPDPQEAAFSVQETGNSFSVVAKNVLPSVVSIATSKIVKQQTENNSFGPLFRDWFGRNFEYEMPENQKLEGLGSGVIVSPEGYILTNNHVVENADDIKVGLYDNREFTGKIVATDPLTEVAVIKIEGENLPVASFGNSEEMDIGDWVLAIGNPLGLSSTVTAGIVSALNRDINIIRDSYALESFIQTDAAINPGNSGGALVNLKSEVIGINTAIASRTGGYQGYGFAIPINLAKRVMQDLIEKGYVTRAWLGISMRGVDANVAERYNMKKIQGARIEKVIEDSPAQKAGLMKLDIILAINGKEMQTPGDVQSTVAMMKPEDVIEVRLLRNGKPKNIKVKLGQRETGKDEEPQVTSSDGNLPDLGIQVQNLTQELKTQYEFLSEADGVLITSIKRYTAAAEAGILRGDLIYKIEDTNVKSVSDYKKVLKNFDKGQVVIFHIKRQDDEFSAFVKLPE